MTMPKPFVFDPCLATVVYEGEVIAQIGCTDRRYKRIDGSYTEPGYHVWTPNGTANGIPTMDEALDHADLLNYGWTSVALWEATH